MPPKAPSAGADPFFGYLSAERLLHSGVNLVVRELLSLRSSLYCSSSRSVVIRTYSSTALDGPMCLSISVRSSLPEVHQTISMIAPGAWLESIARATLSEGEPRKPKSTNVAPAAV
jgi:hypothetical protein